MKKLIFIICLAIFLLWWAGTNFVTNKISNTQQETNNMNSYPSCNKEGVCINKVISEDAVCYYLKDTKKNQIFELECFVSK